MLRIAKWILAVSLALFALGRAATFFGPAGLVPSILGTGGFVSKSVTDMPHPFTFDVPRLWHDSTDDLREMRGSGGSWNMLVQGPQTDVGVTFTALEVAIRPSAPRTAEFPVPGGPYVSLEDFTKRHLPSDKKVITDSPTSVDGRLARDKVYDYVFYGTTQKFPADRVNFRGRAAIFEDRGYYYLIEYVARDAEYDRYVEVFDRAIKSFRFLD